MRAPHIRLALPIAWLLFVVGVAPPPTIAQEPYRILLTNDDGVRAPGLLALADALRELGQVTIVAPAENQSAKSHALTIADPIYVSELTLDGGHAAIAVTATPATCVRIGLEAVMKEPPHLVVSGINAGYNQGLGAYISGTVGAAREAAMRGVPAIAASMAREGHPEYRAAAEMVRRVALAVKKNGLPPGVFLNVNIPAGAVADLKGIRVARQSPLAGIERYVEHTAPTGRRYFWTVYQDPTGGEEGTDVWENERGYVAVTPLKVGEFESGAFEAVGRWDFAVQ